VQAYQAKRIQFDEKYQMKVSVLILTRDEQDNLPSCLESVAWSDDVVVFDSYSVDHTVEIARAAGARVLQRAFDDYASQRNSAMTDVKYKHPWVLMLDADERPTRELLQEIEAVLAASDDQVALYRVRRKDMFLGKWLRRSSGYPTWSARLFKPASVRVEREINEEYHTDGKVGLLKEHLVHYPFNKGIAFWLERHNCYSSMEAKILLKEIKARLDLRQLVSGDATMRRKCLKQVAFRMPCRPFLTFCYLYLFRLGFIDGVRGLTYCRLRSTYEYMIDLKVKELRRKEKGLPL